MKRAAVLLAALLCAAPALASQSYRALVTHVTDGDTLWVRPRDGGPPVPVRLLHLDAPETCQSFGAQSAQALRGRVLHRQVRVRTQGVDDYGRQLARVAQGHDDLGAWLVRNGYAWSAGFHGRPGPYAALERQARSERAGLWALPGALEPRSFRKRFGSCR